MSVKISRETFPPRLRTRFSIPRFETTGRPLKNSEAACVSGSAIHRGEHLAQFVAAQGSANISLAASSFSPFSPHFPQRLRVSASKILTPLPKKSTT
jgi:hypothetical protein